MLNRRWFFFALLAAIVGVVGCSDDDPTTSPSPVPATPSVSAPEVLLRVAHLSPDAPAVDVRVNGDVVLSNVPFRTVSDYLELPSGDYRIQVSPAGATTPVVIDSTVTLSANVVYTVAATGLLADIQPVILVDDLGTSSGARVRVVHAGPDAPPVDIAVSGGPVLFSDVSFRGASPYGEVDAGTYDLEVRVAGTSTVALAIPGLSLSGGTTYTVFAIGLLSDGSLSVLPVVDAP